MNSRHVSGIQSSGLPREGGRSGRKPIGGNLSPPELRSCRLLSDMAFGAFQKQDLENTPPPAAAAQSELNGKELEFFLKASSGLNAKILPQSIRDIIGS